MSVVNIKNKKKFWTPILLINNFAVKYMPIYLEIFASYFFEK